MVCWYFVVYRPFGTKILWKSASSLLSRLCCVLSIVKMLCVHIYTHTHTHNFLFFCFFPYFKYITLNNKILLKCCKKKKLWFEKKNEKQKKKSNQTEFFYSPLTWFLLGEFIFFLFRFRQQPFAKRKHCFYNNPVNTNSKKNNKTEKNEKQ